MPDALNIQHQLLNCSAYLDEVRFALSGWQDSNPIIETFSSNAAPVLLEQFSELLPLHLHDLLTLMPGDLLANGKTMSQEIP
ncbi:MAG: hypothetical protein L3J79_02845 [Candidatus Marinimicrobia bacterium]|nr:hypothetical protein [Candidatus Neomarinimicrobiota bacterium]